MTASMGNRAIVVLSLSMVGLLLGIIVLCIAFSVPIAQLRSSVNNLEGRLDSTSDALTSQAMFTNLQEELSEMFSAFNTSIQQLQEAASQELTSSLSIVVEQLEERYTNLSRYVIPAASCSDIPATSPSGYYSILNTNNTAIEMYCEMGTTCGGSEGGWMRAAYLNMTDENHQCPENLTESREANLRLCTPTVKEATCASITFNLSKFNYSRVCGRIRAYQVGSTDSFGSGNNNSRGASLDGNFVDGVVLTRGSSTRGEHIWTFASAFEEEVSGEVGYNCKCTNSVGNDLFAPAPTFVGEHYFCDTGATMAVLKRVFYTTDPLWDGAGCGGNDLCCATNHPPWFFRELSSVFKDDIEMRVCRDEDSSNEDVAIELVEIYVQ